MLRPVRICFENPVENGIASGSCGESQSRFKLMLTKPSQANFAVHPDLGSWIWDVHEGTVVWSKPLFEIFGLADTNEPPAWSERHRIFRADSLEHLQSAASRCLKTGEPYTLDLVGIHSSGEERFLKAYGTASLDEWGNVRMLYGQVVDLTEVHNFKSEIAYRSDLFRSTFDNASIGVALISLDGHYFQANTRMIEMLGYSTQELVGKPWMEVTHPDDLDGCLCCVRDLLAGRIPTFSIEKRYLHKSGSIVWGLTSVSLARNEEGKPLHLIAQFHETTESREMNEKIHALEDRELTQRFILANAIGGVGVWDWDVVNNRMVWDETMFRLYGLEPESSEPGYSRWTSALHPDDAVRCAQAIDDALKSGEDWNANFRVVWPSGGIRHLRAIGRVKRDDAGRAIRMIGTNWDITEEREKTLALKEATAAAVAANRAKGEFLGVMSHELRTPLSGILGYTDLLLSQAGLCEDVRDKLRAIDASGGSLLRLLDDILDFVHMESGEMTLVDEEFSVSEFAWDVIRIVEPDAIAKHLELTVELTDDVPVTDMRDQHRLRQVVLNLLRNAVKFTGRGSVKLVISVEAQRLRVAVKDTGTGIPAEMRSQIFLPFAQVDTSSARRFGGIGLGLTISSRILKKMGSTLELETEVGKGSTFFFDLPLPKNPGPRGKVRAKALVPGEPVQRDAVDGKFSVGDPLKILVVDDDAVIRKLLVSTLKKLGYEAIETASCGDEALAVLSRVWIDLIFMDLQMPGMDGIAVTTAIREKEAALSVKSPVKIVAVTANSSAAVRNECFAVGMNYYVSKPFTAKSLGAAIVATVSA